MIHRFVALGDSFTEGLDDVLRSDGRNTGWADRVALRLATDQSVDSIEYANLAIRGRLTRQVIEEQVPVAVDMRPDLATLGVGVNDALRRSFDLDAVATDLEQGVTRLRASGAQVLLFAFGDPTRRSRALGAVAGRLAGLRSATREIARIHGCWLVDFWGVAHYDDERMWSADRLHLSPIGHRITAEAVLEAIWQGTGVVDPRARGRIGAARTRIRPACRGWGAAVMTSAGWGRMRCRGRGAGYGVCPPVKEWTPRIRSCG